MNYEEVIMGIIMHGGNARSYAIQAMQEAREDKFEEAFQLIKIANQELNKAHHIQTDLIQKESRGEKSEITLLMVHAQDHLMNAMTVRDLAKEIIALSKRAFEKGGSL